MPKLRLLMIAVLLAEVALGCSHAHRGPSSHPTTHPAGLASTVPSLDAKAYLQLDQIDPPVALPIQTTAPTTAPEPKRPPLDALVLFARARDEMQAGRRPAAVPLLEKAITLDPQSYDLRLALARAYLGVATWEAKSIEQFRRAEEIDPDHADLQTMLGRELVAKGDREEGLFHLRLALKTHDYTTDEADAASAEWFLGNVLQAEGYLTAALDLFVRLEVRLGRPSPAIRSDPELFFVARRPEQLVARIAELHEQLGHLLEAAAVYGAIVEAHPENTDYLGRYVRALARAGQIDQAIGIASKQVVRTSAGRESIALLREACQLAGRNRSAADELVRLHRERPDDRVLLYALVDQLDADDRDSEALKTLAEAAARSPQDFELFRRSIALQQQIAPDSSAAARRLISWSVKNPASIHRLSHLWTELSRLGAPGRLRVGALQKLTPDNAAQPDPEWQAARDYWLYRIADAAGRDAVAREALKRAIAVEAAPFAPAYRAQLDEIWLSSELPPEAQRSAAADLAERANQLGSPSLAAELFGLAAIHEKHYDEAIKRLVEAATLRGRSSELDYARALAERLAGDEAKYERLLWKLVSDWPNYEQAYDALYDFATAGNSWRKADKVVSAWLAAEPDSIEGRLNQVIVSFRSGRPEIAGRQLEELFEDKGGGDVRVLAVMQQLYSQVDRAADFEKKLIERQKTEPANLAVAARLVELYATSRRKPEATHAVNTARAAVADDPDALYTVAHLYMRAGLTAESETALREVLRLDPAHAPAANDLGYNLGDRGEKLEEAERLVRLATQAEPQNPSYLDSLGWVLYKRGKFAQAAEQLNRAITLDREKADPVVRNHLGDALYRVGDVSGAAAQWKQALDRLSAMKPTALEAREDLVTLKSELEQKTAQLKQNIFPKIAPSITDATPATSHAEKSE